MNVMTIEFINAEGDLCVEREYASEEEVDFVLESYSRSGCEVLRWNRWS